jgi:hypothetical protein
MKRQTKKQDEHQSAQNTIVMSISFPPHLIRTLSHSVPQPPSNINGKSPKDDGHQNIEINTF